MAGRKPKKRLNLRTIVNTFLQENNLVGEKLYQFIILNILPDIYNKEITSEKYHEKNHQAIDSLKDYYVDSYAYWENLIGGYSRQNGKYATGGTKRIKEDIKESLDSDLMIIYKATDSKQCSVKENMLNKIENLIEKYDLLSNKDILEEYIQKEFLYSDKLVNVCHELYMNQTKDSLVYLFFLFILVAIYQGDIKSFQTLYNQATITRIIHGKNQSTPIFNEVINSPAFVPFNDQKYCHHYHLYLTKARENRKWQNATIEFKLNENNKMMATLTLQDQVYDPNHIGNTYKKIYTGTPMLNKIDKLVFTLLTSSNGSLAILIFKYDLFESSDLEYRTALFISGYSLQKGPQVQKAVISIDELKENHVIDGILKMSNQHIMITEESLNQFMDENKDKEWMIEFKEKLLPFIKEHEKKYYSFDEDEIISYTNTELIRLIKMDIAKQLKAKSISDDIIHCIDYEQIRRVVKNYKK